jgi:hypothetical protein
MIVICSARSHSVPTGSVTASSDSMARPPASASRARAPRPARRKVQPVGSVSGRVVSVDAVIRPLGRDISRRTAAWQSAGKDRFSRDFDGTQIFRHRRHPRPRQRGLLDAATAMKVGQAAGGTSCAATTSTA